MFSNNSGNNTNPELFCVSEPYYALDNKETKAKTKKNVRDKKKTEAKKEKRIIIKTAREKKRVEMEMAKEKKNLQ